MHITSGSQCLVFSHRSLVENPRFRDRWRWQSSLLGSAVLRCFWFWLRIPGRLGKQSSWIEFRMRFVNNTWLGGTSLERLQHVSCRLAFCCVFRCFSRRCCVAMFLTLNRLALVGIFVSYLGCESVAVRRLQVHLSRACRTSQLSFLRNSIGYFPWVRIVDNAVVRRFQFWLWIAGWLGRNLHEPRSSCDLLFGACTWRNATHRFTCRCRSDLILVSACIATSLTLTWKLQINWGVCFHGGASSESFKCQLISFDQSF